MRLEPGAGAEDTDTVRMSHHSDEGSVMPGNDQISGKTSTLKSLLLSSKCSFRAQVPV